MSFPRDLPLKGRVLWGSSYQVKWLTLVKDFLYLRVNPHRHLNFCVFHQELTPTPTETKAVFLRILASSTRNTRNGVVHVWEGSRDQDARPHPGLWLCDSSWAQSCLSLPSTPAVGGPGLMFLRWKWGEMFPQFPHLIWIFLTDLSQSYLFLACRSDADSPVKDPKVQSRLSNKTFWNDGKFPFCTVQYSSF